MKLLIIIFFFPIDKDQNGENERGSRCCYGEMIMEEFEGHDQTKFDVSIMFDYATFTLYGRVASDIRSAFLRLPRCHDFHFDHYVVHMRCPDQM